MIAVFLNNKLISCDTILPLMLELKARTPELKIKFYCFDWATHEGIKSNIVLRDGIDCIGDLICLQRRGGTGAVGYALHRLRMLLVLGELVTNAWFRNSAFIHFKALNNGVLRILYLLNRKRTYLFESDSCGYSATVERIDGIKRPRDNHLSARSASIIVGFGPDWPLFNHPSARGKRVFVLKPSRQRDAWIRTVWAQGPRYFEAEFKRNDVAPSDDIIVFLLGFMGPLDFLRAEDSLRTLFRETLSVLVAEAGNVPIFLKPHVITDMVLVESELAKHPDAQIVVTRLHPSILATRAKFFVCNAYSTAMSDACFMGVPTVEYSDYSEEATTVTGEHSMRREYISHFINRDRTKFVHMVRSLLQEPRRNTPPVGEVGDPTSIFAELAG